VLQTSPLHACKPPSGGTDPKKDKHRPCGRGNVMIIIYRCNAANNLYNKPSNMQTKAHQRNGKADIKGIVKSRNKPKNRTVITKCMGTHNSSLVRNHDTPSKQNQFSHLWLFTTFVITIPLPPPDTYLSNYKCK
jgi:hypothetical protein